MRYIRKYGGKVPLYKTGEIGHSLAAIEIVKIP